MATRSQNSSLRTSKYLQRRDHLKVLLLLIIIVLFRFAIDLGVPVISISQLLQNVVELAGKNEEFSHSFFYKVKEMVQAEDGDALLRERIHLKLLRLCP